MAATSTDTNYIFIPPPPGRPAFKLPPLPDGSFPRKVNKQQKPTCFLCAIRILLDGHTTPEIHRAISTFKRRLYTAHSTAQSNVDALKAFANGHIPRAALSKGAIALLNSFIFQTDHKTLSAFLNEQYYQVQTRIYNQFIEKFPLQAEQNEIDILKVMEEWSSIPREKWSPIQEKQILESVFQKAVYQAYHCQRSSWHPTQPIERLIDELHTHGPHLVVGYFGRSQYSADPTVKITSTQKEFLGRNIYRWKPEDRTSFERHSLEASKKDAPTHVWSHTVVIVGAKKAAALEHVFYIDPADPSRPGDPASQKVYAISYKTLVSYVVSLSTGQYFRDRETGEVKHAFDNNETGPNDYALHR